MNMSVTQYSIAVIAISLVAIGATYLLTEPQAGLLSTAKAPQRLETKEAERSSVGPKESAKPSGPAKTVKVTIPENAFQGPQDWKSGAVFSEKFYTPNKVEIRVGDTVEWTNKDGITHTISFAKGIAVDSGPFEEGKSWKYTFTKAGEFEYFCTLHPYMGGKVEVQG